MYLNTFPQLNNPNFDKEKFFNRFYHENTIIDASCGEINYAEHTANLSIKLALSGQEYYRIAKVPVVVDTQHFLIINHGQRYASWIEPDSKVASFAIFFTKEYTSDILSNLLLPEDSLLDNPFIAVQPLLFFEKLYRIEPAMAAMIVQLKNRLQLTQSTESMEVQELLHTILAHLVDSHREERNKIDKIKALKLSTRVEIHRRLSKVVDYIHTCFKEPITLKQLAYVACLSENHLLRQFKKTYQITPHAFITQKRLYYASTLLKTTTLPVNSIAEQSGFICPSAFGRIFKTYFRTTPQAYRSTFQDVTKLNYFFGS